MKKSEEKKKKKHIIGKQKNPKKGFAEKIKNMCRKK